MLAKIVEKAARQKAEAEKRVAERGGLLESLRHSEGAIDLASIMVGVIVVGILAGIIAASVFGVIPWAQDNGAKQALDAVKTAESTAYAMGSVDGGQEFYEFNGDEPAGVTLQESENVTIHVSTDGQEYAAVSLSQTGKAFVLEGISGAITDYENEAAATAAAEDLVS